MLKGKLPIFPKVLSRQLEEVVLRMTIYFTPLILLLHFT